MIRASEIHTPRLLLIGADEALLRAELAGREAFGQAAAAVVPPNWPPEHHDRGVIEWVLAGLGSLKDGDPWRFHYLLLKEPRTLVGTCGIKQPPDAEGCVEVGYSVLEQFRRQGLATEAVRALMDAAFAAGASAVAAQTYPSLLPSVRVMEKCGMTLTGPGEEPGTVRYARQRAP
ncbi:MAG TPA: GNAT family N-acetyltransferase [Steroidobacteraceae bacterium]|nr:GNAT family N-acetyltransferase [Steroidobacteraceae bacterium]